MFFKELNSPELKKLRNKVKYSPIVSKTNRTVLELISHEDITENITHETYIPLFNYDTVKSSNSLDKIGEKYITSLSSPNNNGFLLFKEDDYILYQKDEFEAVRLYTTSSTKTYSMFVLLNTITGEIIGGLTFNYNDKEYTANDDGFYYLEEDLS